MKWQVDHSVLVWHIQFLLESLEIQVNQENIHPALTILKVVLALVCYAAH